jgi:hypothetical protein
LFCVITQNSAAKVSTARPPASQAADFFNNRL